MDPEVHEQSGTGGNVAYAEKGVLEVGGSATGEFTNELFLVSARPSIGWFVVNNLELSGIVELGYSEVDSEDPDSGEVTEDSATLFGAYVEPSFHLPFSTRTLGFVGVGVGPTYDSEEFGFSVRPRLGLDLLVGRSGILRPALEATYSTVDVVSRNNRNLVGVSTTIGMSLGFSVML